MRIIKALLVLLFLAPTLAAAEPNREFQLSPHSTR